MRERGKLEHVNKINFSLVDPQAALLPLCPADCQQSFRRHNKDAAPLCRPHLCTLCAIDADRFCQRVQNGCGLFCPVSLPPVVSTHRARTNKHVLESGLYLWSPTPAHQIKVEGVLPRFCGIPALIGGHRRSGFCGLFMLTSQFRAPQH